ncbi:MAG: alanine racemase [Clostridiales bacterium]|jgi:alanine racemase|nr:alanine racemase [Clostridiales bacterium]MDK2933623.1 alanine racemase [Clostridiales bacterium]
MKKLVIEREKLKHNIDIIKQLARSGERAAEIIAVLKGNGYGLDILKFADFLIENGIDFFAVSEVQEAVFLRENGFDNRILLLSSTGIKEEIELIVKNDIIPTIGSENTAIAVNEAAKKFKKVVHAHLKIDTGFGRFGFLPDEMEKVASLLKSLDNIIITGTFSHLSFSFAKDRQNVQIQFDKFLKSIEILKQNGIEPGMRHIANSSAFLRFSDMHLDAVRIGSAFLGRVAVENVYGLKKIGYLKASITEIKELPENHFIGYANTYKTAKRTKTAIVPVGYKDGFGVEKAKDIFRWIDILRYIYHDLKLFLSSKFIYVRVNGIRAKILGRISMYNIVVDVTDMDVQIGDEVILEANPILIESSISREYV